eukprot:12376427-Ditylum_brightwellii.AAC.1
MNLLWSPTVWLENLIRHLVGNKYFRRGDHSRTCGSSIWPSVIISSRRLWHFISTELFPSGNGVYGSDNKIKRPTVSRQ